MSDKLTDPLRVEQVKIISAVRRTRLVGQTHNAHTMDRTAHALAEREAPLQRKPPCKMTKISRWVLQNYGVPTPVVV